jgi:hypothetical protein
VKPADDRHLLNTVLGVARGTRAVCSRFCTFSEGRRVERNRPAPAYCARIFTSEGCSICPPADRLLETFDRTQ